MKSIVKCMLGFLCLVVFPYVFLLTSVAAEAPEELTLSQAYQLALQANESLQRKAQDIKAAEARYREVLSTLYPSVQISAIQRLRNIGSSNSSSSNDSIVGGFTSSAQGKHPFTTLLNVRQPIFTGYRELYTAEATEGEIRALGYDKTRESELLYQDIADVFHQIVYYQADLDILKKTESVLQERITELREFIKLGKSRDGEILAAESDLADAGASIARVSGLLGASKPLLSFLINRDSSSIVLRPDSLLVTRQSLAELLGQATERADLKASRDRLLAAGKEVTASERERWPVIALEGNYYPYEDPESARDWDVLLRMDLSIFEGGGITARIDQSLARQRTAELNSEELKRAAERDIRTAYSNVKASQDEVSKLNTLVVTSKKNYEAQHRDYRLGVVTNLEVLSAIRDVQNAERRLLDAETTLRTNLVQLDVATGIIP